MPGLRDLHAGQDVLETIKNRSAGDNLGEQEQNLRYFLAEIQSFAFFQDLKNTMAEDGHDIHKAIVVAYVQGALISELSPEDFDALVAPWLTESGSVSFYQQFAQADERYTAEIEPMFENIRCPVKVIWGEDDPWIPVERGKALHDSIGQDRIKLLPGVGHLPQLEAPSQVVEALSDFL